MQLLRDIPFTALFWSLTEPMRRAIVPDLNVTTPISSLLLANVTAAGLAGGIAAAATTPFDVIKTQQQTAAGNVSVAETARRVYSKHGWGGLFAGVGPRSLRAVPACAIVVSSYELIKQWIASKHMR